MKQTVKNSYAQSLYDQITTIKETIARKRETLSELEIEAIGVLKSGPALIERVNAKGELVPTLMFTDTARSRRLDKNEVAARAKVDPGEINPLGISKLSSQGKLKPEMIKESYVTTESLALRYRKAGRRSMDEYGHDQMTIDDMDEKATATEIADEIENWLNE